MWEAMKPLPPVSRTVGVGDGPVMITGPLGSENVFGLVEISRNGLETEGGHDARMPVPLSWDDKAGCISAHCGGERLVWDLRFAYFLSGALKVNVQFFWCFVSGKKLIGT